MSKHKIMFIARLRILLFICLPLAWISCAGIAAAQSAVSGGTAPATTGILLLAHGGGNDWNSNVRAIAAEVGRTTTIEIAFGMADRASLQAGIDKLTARGAKQIVAVPLFVSSHSSVIEATRYLLGLRPDSPPDLMDFTMSHRDTSSASSAPDNRADDKPADDQLKAKPVVCNVPLRLAPALNRHPLLAEILADRALAMSHNPAREVVVLVAHGPNDDSENKLWLDDLSAISAMITAKTHFAAAEVTTLRDDAEPAVQEQATQQLRSIAAKWDNQGFRVLIVPVLLSYGGIEDGIRKRLDGLDHVMSPVGILPEPRLAEWVNASASASGKE